MKLVKKVLPGFLKASPTISNTVKSYFARLRSAITAVPGKGERL